MSEWNDKFKAISAQLERGVASPKEPLRNFLLWFGADRRGPRVVGRIRAALRQHGLRTVPDFESAYIGGAIAFDKALPEPAESEIGLRDYLGDPTYRLGRLAPANRIPLSVAPTATLAEGITLMMANDFSQLPVLSGPRDIKGIISWKTIGMKLALGRPCRLAQDCMEQPQVLTRDESLFSALNIISQFDCVLVTAVDRSLCGILTASDFNDQFRSLAEPFLLVGEIENGIRRLLHGKFTVEVLAAAKGPADEARSIESPADLTFGEFIRLLEKPENWERLGLRLDRSSFVARLHRVREIRNDVMHFDPDGLDDEDLRTLRGVAQFLKHLREIGIG